MSEITARLSTALADRYTIEDELGSGGMAIVYLADDPKHDRKVAVKVLRPELAAVLGGERFLQEIRVTARLQHPHILTLIDSGEADGFLYYVMPYVEGESLRDRIRREKQLGLEDTLRIAREVAGGLDYAHSMGFVHRDIKPENILLSQGQAIIADFGIALGVSAAGGERLTETGLSLGTPEYMSPEQATGERDLDGRSDTYSLGCVVYEMLVGEPPFSGTTAQAIMARHSLDPVPSLRTVRASVPEHVEAAVGKALEKIPADRYSSSGRFVEALVSLDLSSAAESVGTVVTAEPRVTRRAQPALLGLAAVLLVAMTVLVLQVGRQDQVPLSPTHTQLTFSGHVSRATLSPDGQSIAYISGPFRGQLLMVQDVGAGRAVTVHEDLIEVTVLGWSPDGRSLFFTDLGAGNGGSYVIPRLGGQRRQLRAGRSPRWSPDGKRIVSFSTSGNRITLTDTERGDTTSIALDGPFDRVLEGDWSPSGDLLAVVAVSNTPPKAALWTVAPDGSRQQLILEDSSSAITSPRWSPRGDAIYYIRANQASFTGGTEELLKVPVSEESGAARGPPEILLSGLQITQYGDLHPFSVSTDGRRLVYMREAQHSNVWLATAEGTGEHARVEVTQLTTGTALIQEIAPSPDGASVAFVRPGTNGTDLFVAGLDGSPPEQITFMGTVVGGIAWSPDARQLVFGALEEGTPAPWLVDVGGTSARRLGSHWGVTWAWTPDSLILFRPLRMRDQRIHVLDPATDRVRPLPSIDSTGVMMAIEPSPDGSVFAILWRQQSGSGLWLLSSRDSSRRQLTGGLQLYPIGWSNDGEFVYAQTALTSEIRAIPVDGGPPSLLAEIPLDGAHCKAVPRSDGRKFVCFHVNWESDAWMVENFDPDVARGN